MPADREAQLLLDLSVLVHGDDKSGVQRLVRNVLRCLLASPPQGWRVAPVYDAGGHYAYAGRYLADADADADADAGSIEDDPIQVSAGDIFLGLDLAPNNIPANLALLHSLRQHGVAMYFVVYDLLPVRQPEHFIAGAAPWFAHWIGSVATVADGLVCISRAVADDLFDWLDEHPAPHPGQLQVGWFHLGADLDAARADPPAPGADEQAMLGQLGQRPTLLMVGTLEPRKMHAQALAALDLLWQDGLDVNLVIVGRRGWLVDALCERLATHPEHGARLFWLERAGDSTLERLYQGSAALLAASSGEGFGLPLIEAAQRGLPVIARDLPVFREVAGEHAFYFHADDAVQLAQALQDWLARHAAGSAPASSGMPWMTWSQSTRQLLDTILQQRWYRRASSRLLA